MASLNLEKLREQLSSIKEATAGQGSQRFLPDGSLDLILHEENISEILCDPRFQIKLHKVNSTTKFVLTEGRKVFAILVELQLEHALAGFIEYGIVDKALPTSTSELEAVLETYQARSFFRHQ